MTVQGDRFKALRSLGMLSSLGIMIVLSTVIGLAFGYQLDKWLGTKPVLTFVFLLLGIISAFVSVYREIKKLVSEMDADSSGKQDEQ